MRLIRKLIRRILLLAAALFCVFVAGVIYFTVHCKAASSQPKPPVSQAAEARKKETAGIKDYARPEESTYLTYPEWYIVWSYQEKADFQEKRLPSGFSYFTAITQYWSGYCCVFGITRDRYAFNVGDHVMLAVIGSSFSVEYALKGVYEKTIGKLTEWLSNNDPVNEDRYAYKVAREYADFVHSRPFYEFKFWPKFKALWSETSAPGPHKIRKWERKLFLSLDYTIEAFYCWLIEQLTHATYGIEGSETYAWIDDAPNHPKVRRIKQVGPKSFLVVMPRYQEFTTVAQEIARQGARFVEIAGNEEIVLTLLTPVSWTGNLPQGKVLFKSGIPTQPDRQRVAMSVPVSSLHDLLNSRPAGVELEHIYDY